MKHVTFFALLCSMLLVANLSGGATQPQPHADSSPDIEQYSAPGGAKGVVDTYAGSDGRELAYVGYTKPGARVALVYLHGIESHAGWFAIAAGQLRERGYDVYCLDRRGSGLNRENRGFVSGHVDDYETLLADISTFIVPLRDRYDEVFLVGLSWGGKLALSYGLTYPEHVDGMILITPGLRAKVDVSLLSKLKIASLSPLHPTARVATPIQPEMFTTTPIYLQYIREDPLRLTSATVRFFWQSHRLDKYVDRNIKDNKVSIQLFLAGQDTIIDNDGVLEVLEKGSGSVCNRPNLSALQSNGVVGRNLLVPDALTGVPPDQFDVKLSHCLEKRQGATLAVVMYEDQTHSVQLDASRRLVSDMTSWIERARINPESE